MKVKLTAPEGKKLRHIPTNRLHSEAIVDEAQRSQYIVDDSDADPIVETIDGVTLGDRVSDLEDAVVELAEIITEGV